MTVLRKQDIQLTSLLFEVAQNDCSVRGGRTGYSGTQSFYVKIGTKTMKLQISEYRLSVALNDPISSSLSSTVF